MEDKNTQNNIIVSPAPHITQPLSTRIIMLDVIIALLFPVVAAGIFFRERAAILIAVCIASALAAEYLCNIIRQKPGPHKSLGDLSAVVTAIILALSVPPAIPYWACIVGTCFAIAIGKMVFGGLGSNIFNPAMAGRAFMAVSFGLLMTTWTVPATLDNAMSTISPESKIDSRTQATPLAWSKQAIKEEQISAETANEQIISTFTGQTGGCLGETSTLAILLGGAYLLIRRTISFHIPLAVIASAFAVAALAWLINPDKYIVPWMHLTTGAMLFGAFFIATDPVTAPLSTKGMWIFAIGVGAITMLIRIIGEYPEGFMFAILLMNTTTPLIDRFCRLTPTGGKPRAR